MHLLFFRLHFVTIEYLVFPLWCRCNCLSPVFSSLEFAFDPIRLLCLTHTVNVLWSSQHSPHYQYKKRLGHTILHLYLIILISLYFKFDCEYWSQRPKCIYFKQCPQQQLYTKCITPECTKNNYSTFVYIFFLLITPWQSACNTSTLSQ